MEHPAAAACGDGEELIFAAKQTEDLALLLPDSEMDAEATERHGQLGCGSCACSCALHSPCAKEIVGTSPQEEVADKVGTLLPEACLMPPC